MTYRKDKLVLVLAAISSLLLPVAIVAQETSEVQRLRDAPDIPEFEQDITVRLRLVDVMAVDSAGDYVTNLEAEDFTVLVNGKEMEIRTFDAYFPGAIDAESESAGIPLGKTPVRRIVLFFDQAFSGYRGLKEAKTAAEEFVQRNLSPGDQVMVVGYDKSLKIHQDFTNDRDSMLEAIDGINYGFGAQNPNRFLSENQFNVRVYLQALQKLALYLKSYRGRKTVVMLSEGFDQRIALSSLLQYQKDMLESFNDSNSTVFSLDVRGLDAGQISFSRKRSRQDTLSVFATETGGKFYFGNNDISELLLSIDSDISHYYVLGFYIDEEPDGRFHDVSVRVDKPGVKLRYRNGFFADRKFEDLNKDERVVQFLEGFHRNSAFSELDARIGAHVYPRGDGSAVGAVLVEAPISNGRIPEFELLGYVYDKDGELVDAFYKRFGFSSRPRGDTFRHMEAVQLEPGTNLIKVGLRDNLSGKRSYKFLSARMPELGSGRYVSTIAFQTTEKSLVHGSSAKIKSLESQLEVEHKEPADPLAPLTREGIYSSLTNEVERSVNVGIILRVAGIAPGDDGPRLATHFSLRGEDGKSYQIRERELKVYPIAGSKEAIVHSVVDFSGVPAGNYVLRAAIDDTIADSTLGQQTNIVLR